MAEDEKRHLKESIEKAIALIVSHPHVDSYKRIEEHDDGSELFEVVVNVNIPAMCRPDGESHTGVRLQEPIMVRFDTDFPASPPDIWLRPDFNRGLPHIQPGAKDSPVVPCYLEGSPRELLYQQGVGALFDQLIDWLEKASKDELIDPSQGWEPIRRDGLIDLAVADLPVLRGRVNRSPRHYFIPITYIKICPEKSTGEDKEFLLNAVVSEDRTHLNAKILTEYVNSEKDFQRRIKIGRSFAILACPGKAASGNPIVCDHYVPETVTNLHELVEQAKAYGCDGPLNEALRYLPQAMSAPLFQAKKLPVMVMLAARRPIPLIGDTSEIEIIPYFFELVSNIARMEEVPVYPVAFRDAISSGLLARLSGMPESDSPRNVVQLGCGSLGSKVAIHLARAGKAPAVVVDDDSFSPHNVARHALYPPRDEMQMVWWVQDKAKALANAIEGMGQKSLPLDVDVVQLLQHGKDLKKAISPDTWAVVNSTASLAVRENLSAAPVEWMGARVIETSLYSEGRIGLLSVEGEGRNPSSSDLILEFYAAVRESDSLRELLFSHEQSLARQEIGQGCGSVTMLLSDAQISLFAASMAHQIMEWQSNSLPEEQGQILIGSSEGMGLTWDSISVEPFVVVNAENEQGWTVRVSPRAQAKISADCAQYPTVETGGIIMGAVSEYRKTITVIDVLPAPADSTRSAGKFELGVDGVLTSIGKYASSSGSVLYCVGTWHSHLAETGASPLDYKTAEKIARDGGLSIHAMLIKKPNSYSAIIAG